MPTSRRRSKHRHRATHGTEHPVHRVPAWTDDERWFEPDDAHAGWVEQSYHEPAPWRSVEPPPDYPPLPDYPQVPGDSPDPDYVAHPADPLGDYPPHQEFPADDYDEGYEQHGPDETPALRGRLVRLPRRRAELPEAVRDCLHWGIFALVLVPIFLIATGGSVLNAIVVMISILVLGVVVIWVVRLGKVALPNLEPAHQLEPLDPDTQDPTEAESQGPGEWQDPIEAEWQDPGEWQGSGARQHQGEWQGSDEWPDPPLPGQQQPEPAWEPFLPPQPVAGEPHRLPSVPTWPSDLDWRPECREPAAAPDEREQVGGPPSDQ